MDFQRMAEFAVVARHQSIKKAAEEIGISSATLSARIQGFEESLGVPLFRREGRALALTEAGARFLPSAVEILENLNQLKRELQATEQHNYHHLRIAITGTALPLHLGPFLDRLNLTYPNVQLELLDDSRYSIVDGLQSGAVDLYFAPVMEDYQVKNIVKSVITTSNQYVLLPRKHPLAGRTSVSIQELDGSCFIPYPRTCEPSIRDFQLANLKASGIRYTLYEGEVSCLFYKLLVPIGKGLILMPMSVMDLPPNTVCVPVGDMPHPATPCFFSCKGTSNPEVLAFIQDYSAYIKEVSRHEHRTAL